MKTLRQITKIISTDTELRAMCISNKGNTIALVINLNDKPELKKTVDEFASKVLEILEKEII
jgi:hypothetical protein